MGQTGDTANGLCAGLRSQTGLCVCVCGEGGV